MTPHTPNQTPRHTSSHTSTHISSHTSTHISSHTSTHISSHTSTHISSHRLTHRLHWLTLLLALFVTLPSCNDEQGSKETLIEQAQNAENSLQQYLENICGCFEINLAHPSTQACVDDLFLEYPFTDCELQAWSLDEERAETYLTCLQSAASRGTACLTDCDAGLIRVCQPTFSVLDEHRCDAELNRTQLDALLNCTRARQ